jgi:hypothetical protein
VVQTSDGAGHLVIGGRREGECGRGYYRWRLGDLASEKYFENTVKNMHF